MLCADDFPHCMAGLTSEQDNRVALLKHVIRTLMPIHDESLVWLWEFGVWPSSGHMPLCTRFRQALGCATPLEITPGHLIQAQEVDDAVSLMCIGLLFYWDCYFLSSSSKDCLFISHDDHVFLGSQDAEFIKDIRNNWGLEESGEINQKFGLG